VVGQAFEVRTKQYLLRISSYDAEAILVEEELTALGLSGIAV
jgi:hypothetical protein